MPAVPRDVIVSASDSLTDPLNLERAERAATDDGRKAGLGFGRPHRLLAAKQYAAVFAARKTVRGARFILHYLSDRQEGSPGARLGLVIPKKQARSAVLRNAIKRQVRETFRHRRDALPALDIILRLTQPVVSCSKPERAAWRAEITGLLDQASRKAVTGTRPDVRP